MSAINENGFDTFTIPQPEPIEVTGVVAKDDGHNGWIIPPEAVARVANKPPVLKLYREQKPDLDLQCMFQVEDLVTYYSTPAEVIKVTQGKTGIYHYDIQEIGGRERVKLALRQHHLIKILDRGINNEIKQNVWRKTLAHRLLGYSAFIASVSAAVIISLFPLVLFDFKEIRSYLLQLINTLI